MDLETNSIFVSRDVIFYEHIFPFASTSSSSSTLSNSPSFDSTSTSFVFPHSVPDSSILDSTFLNDSRVAFPDSTTMFLQIRILVPNHILHFHMLLLLLLILSTILFLYLS